VFVKSKTLRYSKFLSFLITGQPIVPSTEELYCLIMVQFTAPLWEIKRGWEAGGLLLGTERLFLVHKQLTRSWRTSVIGIGTRLRVVSNFGDGDCGAGEIHTHAREISRRPNARGVPKAGISRAHVCISHAPQSLSPKLETSQSRSGHLLRNFFSGERWPERQRLFGERR